MCLRFVEQLNRTKKQVQESQDEVSRLKGMQECWTCFFVIVNSLSFPFLLFVSFVLFCFLSQTIYGTAHVRVAFRLCFKASFSAKTYIRKVVLFTCSYVNKTNFHMKGFALGLALKQRRKATRKWSVGNFVKL